MDHLIRKISVGKDYKNDAMHYAVGHEASGGHVIPDIVEEEQKFSTLIQQDTDMLPGKDFNKKIAITCKSNLEYQQELF